MAKKVWVTSLSKDQEQVTALLHLIKKYGLAQDGHFWVDDLKNMAWQSALAPLTQKDTGLWIICADKQALETESVRYGLSLLCLGLQAARGLGFPVMILSPDAPLDPEDLPTPFKGADLLPLTAPTLGAKITARANTPVAPMDPGYRMDIHANPGFGIWFELGPGKKETWNGVLAGGLASEINAHGVGPAGSLPQKTVLEYQMQGLKLALGGDEYTAWAVQNRIGPDQSYYVRFTDMPGRLIFGPLPGDEDEGEFHLLTLV